MMMDFKPDRDKLRQFGWISLVGFALIAGMIWMKTGGHSAVSRGFISFFLALSLVCPVLGAVKPMALQPVWFGMMIIAAPIGFVVSHTAMTLIYWFVITPIAIVFRLQGRDLMDRKFEPDAETYWKPRTAPESNKRYFRQF